MNTYLVSALVGLTMACSANAATVVNGNFDLTTGASQGIKFKTDLNDLATGQSDQTWDIYKQLAGWTTGSGTGIEIQTDATLTQIDAHSGRFYVELDSNKNSSMYQDLKLNQGRYELTFYYSPRGTSQNGTNTIAYSVGGTSGTVKGPHNGAPHGEWTKISDSFAVGADSGPIRLMFGATGKSDGYGGLIDTVSITAIPVPAPFLMLGVAIAGLFGFGRRKRA